MSELNADFEISNNNLQAEYEINEGQQYDCSFEIFASGTVWGAITGNIEDQADLQEQFATKADTSTVETLSETVVTNTGNITEIQNTIDNYGNIVTYNNTDFATAEQGQKADTAIQPDDNISELTNDAGYITSADLSDYATLEDLSTKQDTIDDLTDIRNNASEGASAYSTISGYGDIVTYNASDFATSIQGALANTALQPNDNISELNNDAGYITSASLPTVNNNKITIQKNSTDVGSFNLNQSTDKIINLTVPTQASDINAVPTSRKVNNNALSSDISLTASDVGALPSTTSINDLTSTAQQNALNSGATSTNISQIGTNSSNISDIQDLIPTEATSTNQLADKNFVNSSVATNTANFIGTFQSVADLEAYSGTLTNNDYAFVETTDTAGNTLYDRYKYTTATMPASWVFEYELNNSSFTSTQWNAINSGANSTNIGQISTNTNDIQSINTTMGGYGDIVTHNTSEFATSIQGGLADTALQPNDSISLLTNDSGYISGINSNDVITALGYTPYDDSNPDGYISGINSSDVTNALGYTPYDNSNPNGYTSNVGTVTSVNNVTPVSGNVTLSIPTVNDGTLTITQNGTSKGTFSANQAGNDTISLTDTTYNAFTGADSITGGASGLVPAPSAGDENKFLKGDGSWDSISGGQSTDVQINGTSITLGGVADILTNSAYSNSNKIATMSDLPASEIFVATYGTTDYADIRMAYNWGKEIFCNWEFASGNPLQTSVYQFYQNVFYFYFALGASQYIVTVDSSSVWSYTSVTCETTSNKVTSISLSSTDTQYPSAKLLYDQLALKQNTSTAVTHTANTGAGSSTNPIYINSSGEVKASTGAVGDSTTPIYMSSGSLYSTGLSIASSRFDGQWTNKNSSLTTSTSKGTYTLSLSSYLPNDNYKYEVLIQYKAYRSGSGDSIGAIKSDIVTDYMNIGIANANARQAYNCFTIPVGTGRALYYQISTNNLDGTNMYAIAYRRMGTNS